VLRFSDVLLTSLKAILCEPQSAGKALDVAIMKPIHTPAAGGRKVNVLGIPMVIRIHGSDTGGVVSAVESHDVPGGGPPPHIHRVLEIGKKYGLEFPPPPGT